MAKIVKKNFKEVLTSALLMSSGDRLAKSSNKILIASQFIEISNGNRLERKIYKYNGAVSNEFDDVNMDFTYNGIPLKRSSAIGTDIDFVKLDHAGKYIVLYGGRNYLVPTPTITGYIIYDRATLDPIEKVVFNTHDINYRSDAEGLNRNDYISYPYITIYDRWNKVFYTYINGARSRKRIMITLIKSNKIEKHIEDVDYIFVERWNPLSGRIYGITFKDDETIEVNGVMQGQYFKTEAKLARRIDFDSIKIDDLHLSVLPDKKADVVIKYRDLLSWNKQRDRYYISTDKDNNPKVKRALVADFKDMQLYVEEDIDVDSNLILKTQPRLLLYKNGKLVTKIPSVFKNNYYDYVTKNNKFVKVPVNGYLQLLESHPITKVYDFRYGDSNDYYGTTIIQGKKYFALVEWGKSLEDRDLLSSIRIFDYNGSHIKTIDTQNTAVPVSQDPDSRYIVYFKQTANKHATKNSEKNSITMNIVDVDTLKTFSIPVPYNSLLWNKVTTIPRSIPRITSENLYNGNVNFKFCCNKLVVYDDSNFMVNDRASIVTHKLFAVVDINTHKAFVYDSHEKNNLAPDIYVQDPFMVLNDAFNALVDDKEAEQER
jgi:hypothetical protein